METTNRQDDSNTVDRRSEARRIPDEYHSLEISVGGNPLNYILILSNISSTGMGILVNKDSNLLDQIAVGTILDVKYNPSQQSSAPKFYKMETEHITSLATGPFKGHVLIGLSIIED